MSYGKSIYHRDMGGYTAIIVFNNPILSLLGILFGGIALCQRGKPGTGKLYTDACLYCSAHTSACVFDGLGVAAAH